MYLDKIIEFQGFIKFQESNVGALFWTEVWMHISFFNMANLKIYISQTQYVREKVKKANYLNKLHCKCLQANDR